MDAIPTLPCRCWQTGLLPRIADQPMPQKNARERGRVRSRELVERTQPLAHARSAYLCPPTSFLPSFPPHPSTQAFGYCRVCIDATRLYFVAATPISQSQRHLTASVLTLRD
jgi:hypothetical protein